MIFRFFLFILSLTIIFLVTSCANNPQKVSADDQHRASSIEEAESLTVTNAAAVKAGAQDFVEIVFQNASSLLSDDAKESLNLIIQQTRQDEIIDRVIVLSWSDQEYPSKKLKRLPKIQKELAEKRNKAIAKYIKILKDVNIDSYNMAVRPNTLSKLFNTTDSKLKTSLLAAGLPTTSDSNQYAGKASHAVILLKVK